MAHCTYTQAAAMRTAPPARSMTNPPADARTAPLAAKYAMGQQQTNAHHALMILQLRQPPSTTNWPTSTPAIQAVAITTTVMLHPTVASHAKSGV